VVALATPAYEKGKLYDIPIIDLRPDPEQPRKVIDPAALDELAASIASLGIVQPLLFRINPDSSWLTIVAGERRYLAAQKVGLTVLPCICVDGNIDEIALIENLQRQDITIIEEAEALQRLLDKRTYTVEQMAAILGKPRTTVSDSLMLLRLPLEIRDECRGNRSFGKKRLLEISRKKQEREMITAFAQYKSELAKEEDNTATPKGTPRPAPPVSLCNAIDKLTERLGKLEASAWTDDEKQAAREARDRLMVALDHLLTATGGGNLA
jgi:ParB family chromosome partitioning protein